MHQYKHTVCGKHLPSSGVISLSLSSVLPLGLKRDTNSQNYKDYESFQVEKIRSIQLPDFDNIRRRDLPTGTQHILLGSI